jgi:hypothetical protein
VFKRRSEISSDVRVGFVADQDIWIYSAIPAELESPRLLFTEGYSIENDLYSDGDVERLMTPLEATCFREELKRFLRWYALRLKRLLSGSGQSIADHPNSVLDDPARYEFDCALGPGEEYPHDLLETLTQHYQRLLRGKSLLALLLRQLSPSGSKRDPKHSATVLLENGATAGGACMERVKAWANATF